MENENNGLKNHFTVYKLNKKHHWLMFFSAVLLKQQIFKNVDFKSIKTCINSVLKYYFVPQSKIALKTDQ